MPRRLRPGFTLIELLIVVVIIGLLAAIGIPKFASTKDRAKVSSMKTDLRNLISLQEGHYADYSRYGTAIGATSDAATVAFFQTGGNTISIAAADPTAGWSATITRADLSSAATCGVFLGTEPAPDPSVTVEGEIACW
jgi:prepilin-type N-terminal cleavage/methylation domain-containing protein